MKIKNIKINFILNLIRMFLGTFFILLTMPYITRVLGSENLGKIEYGVSIVSYFLLFSALGIPQYGIREIARTRDNKDELSKTLIELLCILIITVAINYAIFFFLLTKFDFINQEKKLFFILGTNIIFSNIGIQWFYIGIENQLHITIRFIIFKILTLISLYLLVKKPQDYIIYGGVLVMMESGSNLFNLLYVRKYINIKKEYFKQINIKRHLKPIMTIFISVIAVSIYLKLDGVMIGSMVGVKYVGFYSISNQVVRLIIVIVTALGAVMLPRLSNCLIKNDKIGYINYANISLKYILFISIPSTLGIIILSKEIIYLMAGDKFIPSILTMKIISPIIFIVGISYFVGFQVLYPQGLEKKYTYAVSVAAIINFIFNYIFIPKYYQNGAAVGTVIAEFVGLIIMAYLAKPQLKELEFYSKKNLKYFYSAIVMGIVIYMIKQLNLNYITTILLSLIFGGGIYIGILILFKEELVCKALKYFKRMIYQN